MLHVLHRTVLHIAATLDATSTVKQTGLAMLDPHSPFHFFSDLEIVRSGVVLIILCGIDADGEFDDEASVGYGEEVVLKAEEVVEWRHWKWLQALEDPVYDTDHPYYDSSDVCGSD